MIAIKSLTQYDPVSHRRIMPGYISYDRWDVKKEEGPDSLTISLECLTLNAPYQATLPQDARTANHYLHLAESGNSLGVYDKDELIGIALCEHHIWNRVFFVWEFGVDQRHRRQGIGRRLMDRVKALGQEHNCRAVVLETQNTNGPAICFYQSQGFVIDGVDLSFYSNNDLGDGQVAFFMKYKFPDVA